VKCATCENYPVDVRPVRPMRPDMYQSRPFARKRPRTASAYLRGPKIQSIHCVSGQFSWSESDDGTYIAQRT
jgi:hypothetical protein